MRFTANTIGGTLVDFECDDTIISRWVCGEILAGKTYPHLPFVDNVAMVLDVGANCGATAVHLASLYPAATVHAFEPAAETRAILERNAQAWPNVHVHPIGLHSSEASVPLYKGDRFSGMASIFPRSVNLADSEMVELRAGGTWAGEQGIERIDILKVDVEGNELAVLEGFGSLLDTVKVLYLEYDSRHARRALDHLLAPTHVLYFGLQFMDQGESIYLRNDLADLPAATTHLIEILKGGIADAQADSTLSR